MNKKINKYQTAETRLIISRNTTQNLSRNPAISRQKALQMIQVEWNNKFLNHKPKNQNQ